MAKARGRGYDGTSQSKGGGRGALPSSTWRPRLTLHQPATGSGAAAIAVLAGQWVGAKGETYDVTAKDWKCLKSDDTGYARKYDLSWNADKGTILWGEKFCLHSSDIGAALARWYRVEDERKLQVAFTWKRGAAASAPSVRAAPPSRSSAPAPKAAGAVGNAAPLRSAAAGGGSEDAGGAWAARAAAAAREDEEREKREAEEKEWEKLDDEEECGLEAAYLEAAPGAKPVSGPGADALSSLIGVWWASEERMFRIHRGWACDFTRPGRRRPKRLDCAWDAARGRVLLGRALALDAAALEGRAAEALWYPQDEGVGKVLAAWVRHEDEGEQ